MGWKNWPYWLKGGVIVAIIFFLMFLFFQGVLLLVGSVPGALDPQLNFRLQRAFFISVLILSVMSTFIGFIIGVFIGWIYGKMKKRKK